jgi:murein DD-endopeptidase MepM/ murein hydrolase activator NlpD
MKNPSNSTNRHSRLSYSASFLGGLGLLSSSFITPQVAMTANDFAIPDAPAAASRAIEIAPPAAPSQEAKPRLAAPAAPLNSPTPRIAPKSTALPVNSGNVGKNPLPSPKISVPSRQRSLPLNQPEAPAALQGKNSFIDTASYGQAKSPGYTPPSKVVLTERSTGCSAVSQNGNLLMGSCGSVALKQPEIPRKTSYFAPPSRQRLANINIQQQRLASLQTAPIRLQSVRPKIAIQNTYPRQVFSLAAARTQGLSLSLEPIPQTNAGRYPVAPSDQRRTSLIFPLPIAVNITSPFGWRVHPIAGTYRMHAGTDLGAPMGTPVLAAYGGEVAVADWEGGYGLTVALRHENGTQESRYAHLSEIYVQPGQWVEQCTVIGRVGSTGYSTGPHLHFEWRHLTEEGWVAVDAGLHLEYALDNFLRSLQLAQTPAKPQG